MDPGCRARGRLHVKAGCLCVQRALVALPHLSLNLSNPRASQYPLLFGWYSHTHTHKTAKKKRVLGVCHLQRRGCYHKTLQSLPPAKGRVEATQTRLKVADFGAARRISDEEVTIQTLPYRAPEARLRGHGFLVPLFG